MAYGLDAGRLTLARYAGLLRAAGEVRRLLDEGMTDERQAIRDHFAGVRADALRAGLPDAFPPEPGDEPDAE